MRVEKDIFIKYVGIFKGEEVRLTSDEYQKLIKLVRNKQSEIDEDVTFFHYSAMPDINREMGEDAWNELSEEEQNEWFEDTYINSITISLILGDVLSEMPDDVSKDIINSLSIQEKILLGISNIEADDNCIPKGDYDDVFTYVSDTSFNLDNEIMIRQKIANILNDVEENNTRLARKFEEEERSRIAIINKTHADILEKIECLEIQPFISAIKSNKPYTAIERFRNYYFESHDFEKLEDILHLTYKLIHYEWINSNTIIPHYSMRVSKLNQCWREYYSFRKIYPSANILIGKIDQMPYKWIDLNVVKYNLAAYGYEVNELPIITSSLDVVLNHLLNYSPDILVLYYFVSNIKPMEKLFQFIEEGGLSDRLKTIIVGSFRSEKHVFECNDLIYMKDSNDEDYQKEICEKVLQSVKNLAPASCRK